MPKRQSDLTYGIEGEKFFGGEPENSIFHTLLAQNSSYETNSKYNVCKLRNSPAKRWYSEYYPDLNPSRISDPR